MLSKWNIRLAYVSLLKTFITRNIHSFVRYHTWKLKWYHILSLNHLDNINLFRNIFVLRVLFISSKEISLFWYITETTKPVQKMKFITVSLAIFSFPLANCSLIGNTSVINLTTDSLSGMLAQNKSIFALFYSDR